MDLFKELKNRNISVVRGFGMEKDGLWEPITKTIFINADIYDEIDFENTMLHEFAHYILGHADSQLAAPAVHIKQEDEADDLMVEIRAEEYVESLGDYTDIDIYRFLELFHFGRRHYYRAERIFKELIA